ncbi:YCR061W [Zygosaccharomyces parabailii]|nr:YCR061W [Zygosaccharomyces parabailii]
MAPSSTFISYLNLKFFSSSQLFLKLVQQTIGTKMSKHNRGSNSTAQKSNEYQLEMALKHSVMSVDVVHGTGSSVSRRPMSLLLLMAQAARMSVGSHLRDYTGGLMLLYKKVVGFLDSCLGPRCVCAPNMMSVKVFCFALLVLIGQVHAHEEEMDMDMEMSMVTETSSNVTSTSTSSFPVVATPFVPKHPHGLPILQRPGLTDGERLYWSQYNVTTYFNTNKGNRSALHVHVALLALATVVLYPMCLALHSIRSSWYLLGLLANLLVVVSSLFALSVFGGTFPEDWYPNNAYAKTSWILLFAVLVHFVSAVVTRASRWVAGDAMYDDEGGSGFIPLQEMTPTPEGEPEDEVDEVDLEDPLRRHKAEDTMKMRRDGFLSRVLGSKLVQRLATKFGTPFEITYRLLNYPLFIYLLMDCGFGVAVGNLFGKGPRIFNLLAHWIKGGVFFVLGLISLARYCGIGQGHGWSWNKVVVLRDPLRPPQSAIARAFSPKGTLSMEFIESFLIFFYGSTNIFLEHLAGAGGAWTAKDLQHVSIAFMYIGTGLCGLLTEIKLNEWKFEHVLQHTEGVPREDILQASPGYSPNPFPTFTIFWTGILMSQHAQASEASRLIHMQWGYLLSYGSFFRLLTFIILFLVPNKDFRPSMPFTELIVSFCLLCGGLVFMESTDQVVEALEYRGFTPMFSFNLSVGVVALVMAWEMVLLFWRNWLQRRQSSQL